MGSPKGFQLWPRPGGRPAAASDRVAEFEGYAELVQALADGEPGVIRRLAVQAREASGALFVAIARCAAGGRGVSFEAVEGPPERKRRWATKALFPSGARRGKAGGRYRARRLAGRPAANTSREVRRSRAWLSAGWELKAY